MTFTKLALWAPVLAIAALLGSSFTPAALAQSATSGAVVGTVSDATGAVVPKAEVQLLNIDTNATQTQVSNDSGGFFFPNTAPGNYRLTVKMQGFRMANVSDLKVEVNKSLNVAVNLEVGADREIVEVTATAAAQLQTTDSQIGNSVSTDSILRLPTLQRNATELMGLQPATSSTGGANIQLRVAGGVDDQNTVTVDGIDITQGVVAANTALPTPADSIEEFRGGVSNPNANFDRSSGGNIVLIGRRGSNTLHGALYEYFQNFNLNANTWDNNHLGLPKTVIHDNRFGGRIGGPIIKNKTFIFGNYEGRRFQTAAQMNRTVPTETLRQGILQFRDASGTVQRFDLKTASVCGTAGNAPCDPRGLGLDPSVKASWDLMPLPNLAGGDGLNTGIFFGIVPTPVQDDYGVARLDHNFTDKIQFNGSYTYFRRIATCTGCTTSQTGGDLSIINGQLEALVANPQRGSITAAGLTWQIKPNLLNVFRFGYVHDTNATQATTPTQAAGRLNIPGTSSAAGPIAMLVGSGVSTFIDSPIDMDTQRARYQANYNGYWQYIDDMTWVHGRHSVNFGVQLFKLPYTHVRADKVVGSLTSLAALADGDRNFLFPTAANQPLTCGGSVTTNCVRSTDLQNWNRFYASTLGLVDNINILAVRDGNLNPLPFGTNLRNQTNSYAPYFFVQDSWRIKPTLTITAGLAYGWQTSPKEVHDLQTLMINASTGALLNGPDYMTAKLNAALNGQIYNPTVGFLPVGKAGRGVVDVDYGNWAPRASFAWNPAGKKGLMSWMGDRKTVIRGGFGLIYDRTNLVQTVLIPMLGVGYGQTINVQAPLCNVNGASGAGCDASAGAGNVGLSAFRVGVDGTLPLPTVASVSSPVIPPVGKYSEILSFQADPKNKVGRSYNFDLSLQREIPGNMLVEVAFVGRHATRLPQAVSFSNAPYMFVDKASGQSFAQAYDTVANALRANQPVPIQPWFENQLPGIAQAKGSSGTSTAYVASALRSAFTTANLSSLFFNLDGYRRTLSLPTYDNDQAQTLFMRTYIGQANYMAGFITVTKRMSHGLTLSGNYTYSKALDDNVLNQNQAFFYGNSFHPGVDYGPSSYDRRHIFNAHYYYDLPAGHGHKLSGGPIVNGIIGGWYASGIVTAYSGVPLIVTQGNNAFGADVNGFAYNTPAILTSTPSTASAKSYNSSCKAAGANAIGAGGSGMNIFADPCAVFNSARYVNLSSDTRTGRANPFYGLPFWNFDMSFGKSTKITERVSVRLSADMFNVFNHPNFANPYTVANPAAQSGLSLQNPNAFGVITSTFIPANRTNSARWVQFGLRLEF
jgi:hypothetical protein